MQKNNSQKHFISTGNEMEQKALFSRIVSESPLQRYVEVWEAITDLRVQTASEKLTRCVAGVKT
jgi:hypothetical protein